MRVQVLGPLEVRLHDEPVQLGGPKQLHVLACLLAARSQAVSVGLLAEDLWGDDPPATAPHVISTYVSGLRKVFGDRIRSDGARHALVLREGDVVDALELEEAVGRAHVLVDSEPAAALAQLPDRVPTDRPFGGLADDSEMVRIEAHRIEEVQLQAAQVRIEAELRLGRHEDALPGLGQLCERYPRHEGLHAQRMLALYRAGRQVEALDTYRVLREVLVGEYGIDPSQELKELELRILLQDDGLLMEPPHVLPTPMTGLVGRLEQIGAVVDELEDHRLVTLIGPGGVGKTRLAMEVARVGLPGFAGGTWWVDLAAVDRPDRVAPRVATVLGLPDIPGAEPEAVVRSFLAPRKALLVLDNCEHLLPALAEEVAGLLEGAALLTVLATSRRPLAVPGEHRVPVGPLVLDDAAQLFRLRARDAGAEAAQFAGTGEAIGRICELLDRLPLAIELAASRGGAFSVDQIAERLAADPTLRGVELSGVSGKHRSLDAMIDWGYRLLIQEQRADLERLSVFDGPFDLEAAVAVARPGPGAVRSGEESVPSALSPVDSIAALVDWSLLAAEPSPDGALRYRMLETVRSFSRTRLAQRGATNDARHSHALHHLGLFEAAGSARLTPGFADWMPRLDAAELETDSALGWAQEHLAAQQRAAAAPGLLEYWFRRGDPVPAYRFGLRLLEDGAKLPPRLEAAARLCAGFGGAFVGDLERATTGLDTAIDLLEGNDDWRGLVWALLARGQNATVVGDTEIATAMGRRILEVCADHSAALPRAYGLALLGEAEFLGGGDLAVARRYTEEAIEGLRLLRDPASLNLFGLGIAAGTCAMQGDLSAAERYAVEATTLPGPGWRATAYVILGGWVLQQKGETARAIATVRRGVALAHQMSMPLWVRHGLLMLARLAAQEQRWEDAARLFGAARPQPPWGQAPHWWLPEQTARDALGADRFDALSAAGATLPLNQWMVLLTGGQPDRSTRSAVAWAEAEHRQ